MQIDILCKFLRDGTEKLRLKTFFNYFSEYKTKNEDFFFLFQNKVNAKSSGLIKDFKYTSGTEEDRNGESLSQRSL